MQVIGLSGKAGAGKDWIGREVLRPEGYVQWAFAWPMKMDAVGRGVSYEDAFVTKPPAVREMLQRIGTEEGWHRHGKNYWCDIAGAWLRTMEENLGVSKFYFTDVRFPHEVEFIKALGGKVVRIYRTDGFYPLAGTPAADHESETALDRYFGFDLSLNNNAATSAAQHRWALSGAGILPPAAGRRKTDPRQMSLLDTAPDAELYSTAGRCCV